MKNTTFYSLLHRKSISFLVLIFATIMSFAQNPYIIQFQGEAIDIPENIDSFAWSQMPESAEINNGYVGWIQFYETPTQDIQDLFKANNLRLLEYIPHKAYLFYFPNETPISFLRSNGVRGIVPVDGRVKLSEALKNGDIGSWAIQGDHILVTLEHHSYVSTDFVINDLSRKQIAVVQQYKGSTNIDLAIPNNCLEELSNLAYVKWVEVIVAPDVKDDTRGRSLHRSSGLDTQTGAGRNYTGVGVGVMVRDDGIVGPHIDFEGRIDNSGASGTGQTHGDGVAGIMAGAGNLNPLMRGMAAGSDVFVVNYVANFLDSETQNFINNGDVQITNSSYSNGCNAGYTSITRTVDQQTRNIPSLLHVFSAGNSNNQNCGYGAGNQWGNITGGHKQGKNVIATANVFFDGSLVNSSSRGPAHDGRIKPDITANGQNQNSTNENNGYLVFGGTSGAAPGIAGVSAQLYEAYANDNGGTLPPSALIKATLLNTANDAGNIGPDFRFGWGIVNALRAGILIEDGRYLSDNITQGTTNTHSINVPAGTTQVRFMVYWSDPEASAGASPALVNDLDLIVNDPSNNDLEPWILDHTPNATTLNLPATTGPDHLNNMEQVLINNPAAGSYDVEITGFNVPQGPQEYFVVYEIISENLTVTYPNAGEHFVPSEQESLHWDAVNTTNDFVLEYSTDNGGTWNNITTVNNDVFTYQWSVPSTVTGEALIRVTSGSFSDTSDGAFSIAPLTTGLDISQLCPADITFAWNPVTGAESYDVYVLGAQYMEIVGNSTSNTLTVAITDPNAEIWYAIVAKNDTEGWESRRTIANFHPGGLVNCSLNNDLSLESINNSPGDFSQACASGDAIVSITIRNTGVADQSNFDLIYQIGADPAVTETYTATLAAGQQDVFEFTETVSIGTSGNYTLTTTIDLASDQNTSNNERELDFFAQIDATPAPYTEPFDVNGMPPSAWSVINPDGGTTWEERSSVTGSDGNSTVTAFIDNFTYNAPLQEDVVETEVFDLNISQPVLNFDLAKAQYSASLSDAMRVEISIDCGTTYTSIYNKDGLDLSTIGGFTTSNWSPTSSSDWRTESIDLGPYQGETVIFRFVNINGYGNSTFIDNINVEGSLGIADQALGTLTMYPNPTINEITLAFGTAISEAVTVVVTNNLGQTIETIERSTFNGNLLSLNVSDYATGLYFVTVQTGNQSVTKKLIVR